MDMTRGLQCGSLTARCALRVLNAKFWKPQKQFDELFRLLSSTAHSRRYIFVDALRHDIGLQKELQ